MPRLDLSSKVNRLLCRIGDKHQSEAHNSQRDDDIVRSGGQSINIFDYYLAPYVLKSFNKEYKKYLNYLDRNEDFQEFESIAQAKELIKNEDYDKVYKETEKLTYQAMEAFIHNMCSLNSRAGQRQAR